MPKENQMLFLTSQGRRGDNFSLQIKAELWECRNCSFIKNIGVSILPHLISGLRKMSIDSLTWDCRWSFLEVYYPFLFWNHNTDIAIVLVRRYVFPNLLHLSHSLPPSLSSFYPPLPSPCPYLSISIIISLSLQLS